jgi:hypothetical protein
MKLIYFGLQESINTSVDNLTIYEYYIMNFIINMFNSLVFLSNNYFLYLICLVLPICVYFDKFLKPICFLSGIIFLGRVLTYENHH